MYFRYVFTNRTKMSGGGVHAQSPPGYGFAELGVNYQIMSSNHQHREIYRGHHHLISLAVRSTIF